ncbi:MAG: fatty-acyl-CoA synthase, partial [Mycobacterium sp.]|nr:fatty-acyl-CoA synthase [Mycobacterium sp.]
MAGDTVGLTDIAARLPALVLDAPVVARGTVRAFLVRGSAKRSIGRAFQDRAMRCPDHVFIRFDDEGLTYREANETVNRYAATLAGRGVGRGDVVGVIMGNSARTLLVMLAVVKLGAIAGMLNEKQRSDVLAHSVGLLHARVIVGEQDLLSAVDESEAEVADTVTIDELDRLSADAPTENPAVTSSVRAEEPAFYMFTSGTTGAPKASVMTHYRWLRAMGGSGAIGMRLRSSDTVYCCLPLYHNTALTVAVSGVIGAGATLALGRSFSASRFWDDVTRYDATAFVYIGEVCRYLLNQP